MCGRVKHSVTRVHGDKLFVIQPSLARSLWAWTKISKDQSSHSSALSPQVQGNVSEGKVWEVGLLAWPELSAAAGWYPCSPGALPCLHS